MHADSKISAIQKLLVSQRPSVVILQHLIQLRYSNLYVFIALVPCGDIKYMAGRQWGGGRNVGDKVSIK